MTGQRNAIDGRIVEIVAELDRGGLVGITGDRSVPALVAWKTGPPTNPTPTRGATLPRTHRRARRLVVV